MIQIMNNINQYIINYIGYKNIGFIILIIIILLWIKFIRFRNQYSDEAWKIIKKNGRKSVFWYDENGNKTYKKPKIK